MLEKAGINTTSALVGKFMVLGEEGFEDWLVEIGVKKGKYFDDILEATRASAGKV